jgi:hypothetical protein
MNPSSFISAATEAPDGVFFTGSQKAGEMKRGTCETAAPSTRVCTRGYNRGLARPNGARAHGSKIGSQIAKGTEARSGLRKCGMSHSRKEAR